MKKINITYWIVTVIFAAFMIFTSIPDIMSSTDAVNFMKGQLGYPQYIIPFIGIAKLSGAIVILIPGFPRIKEWAYAGLVFDLVGAMYSVKMAAPGMGWTFMFLPLSFAAASYILLRKKTDATRTSA